MKYKNSFCPVCKSRLFDDDDIVVCPVCGAPHHRSCYQYLNRCAHESQHGSFVYAEPDVESPRVPPAPPFSAAGGSRAEHKCPRCGRETAPDVFFCPQCGYSLNSARRAPAPPFGFGAEGFRPFVLDPYGGVDPSETIEDATAADVSKFVSANSARYVSKFYQLSKTGTKASWNWAAFLFPSFWFFFRKLYKEGVIFTILSLLSTVLYAPVMIKFSEAAESLAQNASADYTLLLIKALTSSSALAIGCFIAGVLLSLGARIFGGLLGDYLYFGHCISSIRQIRSEDDAEELLPEKGGVNILAPLLANTAVFFISNMIQTSFM